uniref:HAT C-terminal dimerisation domain-containing protein n=1 Tax=Solanum lycopersicum TaxID=4081 RepID=A0A3Q7GHJ3_SOLLC
MVILDELPFSFVEKEGFKKFMSKVQSLFHIPSRRTITRNCYEVYGELKINLKQSLREIQPRICLTTDTWISVQRINYMCLSAHFIDRDWLDNVFTVTVDNASANDVTVLELSKKLDMWGTNLIEGKHLHVRCMAHILNLIVQDGLKEIGPAIKRVRQMVKYVRSSSSRTRNFLKCVEMQKIECDKMLSLDVPTRWNSTYLMLDTTEKFEKAFERFDLYDGNFNSFLATDICEDGSIAESIQYEDWANVRNVTKFLEKFYELTLKVSGSRYVTCNVHFEDICELDAYLKLYIASDDLDLSKMASGMKEKFKKYWGTPEKMNKMIFVASFLDPRNKFVYVSFALEELLGEETRNVVNTKVEAYLRDLFVIYVSKYGKGSKSQPSSSDSSDSSASGISQYVSKNSLRTKLHMKKQKNDSGSLGVKSELDKYLLEDQEPESGDFDILSWWKVNSPRFPVLSQLARDVLAIPMSSVASECAFTTGGRILDL